MKRPRGLSPEDAALWAKVARTVTPLDGRRTTRTEAPGEPDRSVRPLGERARALSRQTPRADTLPEPPRSVPRPAIAQTLDGTWDRKLARGVVAPDFTLDLHGCTLDQAHARLDHGLAQALAMGARIVLLVIGRARPSNDHAGRSERRGAIRNKFRDWIEAGPHAGRIAAIRPAHPRHGGAGAVYIVLRRAR